MNKLVLALSLSALILIGYWCTKDLLPRKEGTAEPKVRVRGIRKYTPPTSVPPSSSDIASQSLVILKQRRQISTRDYPQIYRPRATVRRQLIPLYEEMGWRKNGHLYQGYYQANGRKWRGEIYEHYRGFYEAFIYNPPVQNLKRHPHGPCFNPNGVTGRWKVHFREMPMNVDQAIMNIETILKEALSR